MRRTPFRAAFVALVVASAILGLAGTHQYLVEQGGDSSALNVIGGTLSLYFGGGLLSSGEVPAALALAGVLAPLTTVAAAAEVFGTQIDRRFRRWRARHRRNHVVLVGIGRTGGLIAEHLATQRRVCVVGVDVSSQASGSLFDRRRWAVIEGSGLSIEVLRRAGAHNAEMVHVATGRDGIDLAVANTLRSLAAERTAIGSLDVRVQLDSPELAHRLLRMELERTQSRAAQVEYLNIHGLTAAAVFEFLSAALAESTGMPPGTTHATDFAVVGDTRTCVEIHHLAQRSHRARALLGLPTTTTHAPLESVAADWTSASFSRQEGGPTFDTIVVVHFRDPERTVEVAMKVACRQPRGFVVVLGPTGPNPVHLAHSPEDALTVLVDPDSLVQSPEVLSFGPIELMARLIHLDYVAKSDWDSEATVEWSSLPDTYRRSSRAQAFDFTAKLRLLGCELSETREDVAHFTSEEIEQLATYEHDRWMAERMAEGWVFGSERDNERKVHPDLIPYDQLSDDKQDLDRQAIVRLPALAALVGLVVVRSSKDAGGSRVTLDVDC